MGHETVTHGFGLRTGDCGGDTGDGAADCGRPAQPSMDDWEDLGVQLSYRLLFLFLRYGTTDWPDWAKRGRQDCVCVDGCFKGTLGFLMETFCHYSEPV